jgi:hypothetical protein
VGRQELIPLEDGLRWTAALAELPHGHAHTHGFCHAVQLTSAAPTYLYRWTRDGARVVCVVAERELEGEVDVTTPYGFGGFAMSGDCTGFAAEWQELARRRGWVCGYIALNPLFADAAGLDAAEVAVQSRLYVLDLSEPREVTWGGLSENRRRQLRHFDAVAAGFELDRGRLARFLVDEFAAFFARRGAGPATDFRDETVAAIAALDNVLLVGAGDGELESVAAFGFTAHAGDYLFGISRPGGERHSAHLVWWGAERLRDLGVPSLNLGGGVRPGDDVAEFKRRFGATERPLASLRQVYRPDVYKRLCEDAGVSPARSGWFPPYRAVRAAAGRPTSPGG